MHGALLVTNKNVCELISIMVKRIINGHDRSTGITKQRSDAFGYQGLKQGFGT
jgi:hypothetical protein